MKESEAKLKVCPFIQDQAVGLDYQRVDDNDTANINCITSKCMAWVWLSMKETFGTCSRLSK